MRAIKAPAKRKPGLSAGGRKSRSDAAPEFWRRRPNAELDRAGDWLLANLSAIRAEATSRGDSL